LRNNFWFNAIKPTGFVCLSKMLDWNQKNSTSANSQLSTRHLHFIEILFSLKQYTPHKIKILHAVLPNQGIISG